MAGQITLGFVAAVVCENIHLAGRFHLFGQYAESEVRRGVLPSDVPRPDDAGHAQNRNRSPTKYSGAALSLIKGTVRVHLTSASVGALTVPAAEGTETRST